MSTLDINSIRDYLIEVGCKVEYPILVNAFKKHLYNPDPAVQSIVRTQFKDYVNRLSTVNVENNMKFITLRPEFRPNLPGPQAGSPLHNGHTKPDQRQQLPQRAPPSPPPPLPPPMLTSSPKRAPDQPAPASALKSKPQLPPVAIPHRDPTIQHQQSPHLQSPHTQSIANDRLDSPASVVQARHGSNSSMNQSPPAQVQAQARRQHTHQATPRPPPVPPHHRAPGALHHAASMGPPQAIAESPSSEAASLQPGGQTQHFFAPPSQPHQQSHYHYRSQSQPVQRQMPPPVQAPFNQHSMPQQLAPNRGQDQAAKLPLSHLNSNHINATLDPDAAIMPPPPPPAALPLQQRQQQRHQSPLARQSSSLQKLDSMPPPRPPPRRRQSTASLHGKPGSRGLDKTSQDNMQDLQGRKSVAGRLRDQAHRSYSSASTNDLGPFVAKRNSSMKENRLSRDSNLNNLSSSFQSISFSRAKRSRSSNRGEDESDSSSLQPNDPLRRRWTLEASGCNYNNLLLLLREDPKLAACKDIMNGYTALHWAAKFGNLEIIRLIAGTYGVSVNIKSSAGQTPLHVAYLFNRLEAVNLLLQSYQASTEVRDHSGKRPMQYWQKLPSSAT